MLNHILNLSVYKLVVTTSPDNQTEQWLNTKLPKKSPQALGFVKKYIRY